MDSNKVNVYLGTQVDEVTDAMVKRLAVKAVNITDMLARAYTTPKGVDGLKILSMAAGLAGYACHKAVSEEKGSFHVVTSLEGKEYYFSDDVNAYLYDGATSVIGLLLGLYGCRYPDADKPDVKPAIEKAAANAGHSDYRIAGLNPNTLMEEVMTCFDAIKDTLIIPNCESPKEWPVLMGIVLQSVADEIMRVSNPREVFDITVDIILYLSKMDVNSL